MLGTCLHPAKAFLEMFKNRGGGICKDLLILWSPKKSFLSSIAYECCHLQI